MGRGSAFTHSEDEFLITNVEQSTAQELFSTHEQLRIDMMWSQRSLKSLARRVERLRIEGRLEIRDEETRRKAYYGRHQSRGE